MQTEKAKSSHFDRTRGDKKQIFPTLVSLNIFISEGLGFSFECSDLLNLKNLNPSSTFIFLVMSEKNRAIRRTEDGH